MFFTTFTVRTLSLVKCLVYDGLSFACDKHFLIVECLLSLAIIILILPWFCGCDSGCSWIWFWSILLCVSTTLGMYWYRFPLATRQVMTTHSMRMIATRSVIMHPRLISTQQSIPLGWSQLVSSASVNGILLSFYKWRSDISWCLNPLNNNLLVQNSWHYFHQCRVMVSH